MKNPYFIDEPCVISFSGGRTSAYMLYKILEAHGGTLPADHHVLYANTGKEVDATLDFVSRCEFEFGVPIVWLEYAGKKEFKIVNYETASRKGEPFAQLIEDRNCLPNPMMRFCTGELKVLTIDRYMKSIGVNDYLTAIGIRADEPRRVTKMNAKENYHCPLAIAGVTKPNVRSFWDSMPWDLETPSEYYSNCDLCYLKSHAIKLSLIRDGINPDWWIGQESKIKRRFRNEEPDYQSMKNYSGEQINIFDDESIPCFCGD